MTVFSYIFSLAASHGIRLQVTGETEVLGMENRKKSPLSK